MEYFQFFSIKECKKLTGEGGAKVGKGSGKPENVTTNGREDRRRLRRSHLYSKLCNMLMQLFSCFDFSRFHHDFNYYASGDREKLSSAIHQLVKQGIQGGLRKDKVVATINELIKSETSIASVISDVFCTLDLETGINCSDNANVQRENFCSIVRSCNPVISYLLQERMEMESLSDVGTIGDFKIYNKRFIRVKTKV